MQTARPRKNGLVVFVHIASWVILFTLPALLRPDFSAFEAPGKKAAFELLKTISYFSKLWWIGFFYLNAQLLIPEFAYRQQYGRYGLSILFTLLFLLGIDRLLFWLVLPELPYNLRNFLFFNLFPLIFMLAASTTYRLVVDRINTAKREQDRITEQLKTELSLLRSQVSPHFMFNVLNSMVAMARKKSDLLEDSLIKLSHLLRYMLYETAQKVTINRELEYLGDYIDLQRLRFGQTVDIKYTHEIADPGAMIEPMLLIPFVENAFKHGVVSVSDPCIRIHVKETGHTLELSVENKYNISYDEVKDATSGIGLDNVTRRLELLYPDAHLLQTESHEDWYIVHLRLQLR
jgi:hypothetical protein